MEMQADQIVQDDQMVNVQELNDQMVHIRGAVLRSLYKDAVATCEKAVRKVEEEETKRLRETGDRLRAEQNKVFEGIMTALAPAVHEAAAKGQRMATVLRFEGSDKFDEFCYLYMIKGPIKPELRQELKDMGVRPLLYRLRDVLHPAGFGVHHAWQRATNENTVSVSW